MGRKRAVEPFAAFEAVCGAKDLETHRPLKPEIRAILDFIRFVITYPSGVSSRRQETI